MNPSDMRLRSERGPLIKLNVWSEKGFLLFLLLVAVASVLIISVELFILVSISEFASANASTNWPTAKGVVVSIIYISAGDESEGGDTAKILYTFSVEGTLFRGSRVSYGDFVNTVDWVSRYNEGQAVSVYYRPGKPSDCVLESGIKLTQWGLLGIELIWFSVAFFIWGALLLVNINIINALVIIKNSIDWPVAKGKILPGGFYEFSVEETLFNGNRISYGSRSPKEQQIVDRYTEGQAVFVYYRPGKPSDCVLEPGIKMQGIWWLKLGLISFFFLSLLVYFLIHNPFGLISFFFLFLFVLFFIFFYFKIFQYFA